MRLRITCMFLLALLMSCATPPKSQIKEEAKGRWEQMRAKVKLQLAERNFEGGQMDDALKVCQEVLALEPKNLEAHLLMARLRLEKGQMPEAQAVLDEATGISPDAPEVAYLRGIMAERRNQMAEAIDAYKKAYETRPNEPDYLVAYVESMLSAGQIGVALDLLTRRERDFEQDVRVQMLVGQAFALRGDYRQASDAYVSAVRLAPANPLLREEAGLALLSAKRIDEAQSMLDPLLNSPTDKPSRGVVEALANALLVANQPTRAIAVLEPAATDQREAFAIQLLLSKAYASVNRHRDAREAALQACRLKPESVEARLMLAYCAMLAGDRDQAIATAQEIVAAHPNDAQAVALLQQAAAAPSKHPK
jgi:tetratricopeptide (TPR) repeat protein